MRINLFSLKNFLTWHTVWCKFLIRENIDKIDEFLVVPQTTTVHVEIFEMYKFLQILWYASYP